MLPTVIARHRLAPDGAGATIRDDVHVSALNAAALAASTPAAPHRGKARLPPSATAREQAAVLRAAHTGQGAAAGGQATVVDLARYAAAATGRNTLRPIRPTHTESETS